MDQLFPGRKARSWYLADRSPRLEPRPFNHGLLFGERGPKSNDIRLTCCLWQTFFASRQQNDPAATAGAGYKKLNSC
jgi:hypothetical protein